MGEGRASLTIAFYGQRCNQRQANRQGGIHYLQNFMKIIPQKLRNKLQEIIYGIHISYVCTYICVFV